MREASIGLAPGLAADLARSEIVLGDIQWLGERKYATSSDYDLTTY
jgi:hypothetical protein